MRNALVFIYCCVCVTLMLAGYASSATTTSPELKIPLDSYYVTAPDGTRLDQYLIKSKDRVVRRTIYTDGSSPYSVRVLAQDSSSFQPAIVKVSAFKGGNAAYESAMTRQLSLQTLLSEQNTTSGNPINIVIGLTQQSATLYYVDIKVYDCTNGVLYIEYEKL